MYNNEHSGSQPRAFTNERAAPRKARHGLFAVGVLAALLSTQALAYSVTAPAYTPNSGVAGELLRPQLRIADYASDLDPQAVVIWEFYLSWFPLALAFDPGNSKMTFHGNTYTLSELATFLGGIGSVTADARANDYALQWVADGANVLDLGSEIDFQGAFTIKSGAPAGDYAISLDREGIASLISDANLGFINYAAVTSGAPMTITVLAPAAIPEPATLALLLAAGCAGFGARRRRS